MCRWVSLTIPMKGSSRALELYSLPKDVLPSFLWCGTFDERENLLGSGGNPGQERFHAEPSPFRAAYGHWYTIWP
jgi:hypothetical protein